MNTLNKYGLIFIAVILLIGGGCEPSTETPDLQNDSAWERISDPYLGISIKYPINIYDVELASGDINDTSKHQWMTLTQKNSNGAVRIEVWKLSDFPIERDDPSVDFPPGYEEKIIAGQTYGIYISPDENGDRLDEMRTIIDTLQ